MEAHHDWVRLRTLIFLRWTAVAGQLGAIVVAMMSFDIALDLPLCLAAVGASVAANLVAIFLFPENKRLTQTEAAAMLLFDTAQLALLLALTGGLSNPFALLILVPVTIAATALERRPTLLLGGATIGMITLTALYAAPLVMRDGTVIEVPPIFEFGYWLAVVIGHLLLPATHPLRVANGGDARPWLVLAMAVLAVWAYRAGLRRLRSRAARTLVASVAGDCSSARLARKVSRSAPRSRGKPISSRRAR